MIDISKERLRFEATCKSGHDMSRQGARYKDPVVQGRWETWLAAKADAFPSKDALRDIIEGMSVSIDVSTGEHDLGNRLFGKVSEVMDCDSDRHGLTLLVYSAEPNWQEGAENAPPPTDSAAAQIELIEAAENLSNVAESYFHDVRTRSLHEAIERTRTATAAARARQHTPTTTT